MNILNRHDVKDLTSGVHMNEPPEIDLKDLPYPLGTICRDVPFAEEYPPIFLLTTILAVAAGIIGNRCTILGINEWSEPFSIYSTIIAPPGSRKNNPINFACAPILSVEKQNQDLNRRNRERYGIDLEIWRKGTVKLPENMPIEPPIKMTVIMDVTVETMPKLLLDNPAGIVMAYTELSTLILGLNAYKGGFGSDVNLYLNSWDLSSPYCGARGGVNVLKQAFVERPRLSITGPLTPANGFLLLDKHSASGFASRFIMATAKPAKQRPTLTKLDIPDLKPMKQLYHSTIMHLFKVPWNSTIKLSQPALCTWAVFCDDINQVLFKKKEINETIRWCLSKICGITLRIAGTLQKIINPLATEIDEPSMTIAVRLSSYYVKSHNFLLEGSIRQTSIQPDKRDSSIIRSIDRLPGASKRTLYKNCRMPVREFDARCEALIKAGVITSHYVKGSSVFKVVQDDEGKEKNEHGETENQKS